MRIILKEPNNNKSKYTKKEKTKKEKNLNQTKIALKIVENCSGELY